jgi:formate hydrogenlyase subunit 6/NADH:ubiquinone oxidoreductase subunit I
MVFSWVMSILKPLGLGFRHIFKYRFTVKYPYYALKLAERYRGRPILDLERCVGCKICANVCPNKVITMVKVGDKTYPQFDLGRCAFCGLCVYYCVRSALTMAGGFEIAEYDKEGLIYTPERLSKPPPPVPERKKYVTVKKLSLRSGVTHG